MKLMKTACIALLCPALAIAGPNRNTQDRDQNDSDVESETFAWSSGQGRLGVMVMSLTPELRAYFGAPKDAGLLVAHVDARSPAARAGVRVGDVITKVGDNDVSDAIDIITTISQPQTSTTIPIEVLRNHTTVDLEASLMPRNNQQNGPNQHI